MNKHIFISYSHLDKEIAFQVIEVLDSIGLILWIDHKEILPGNSFIEKMNEGLNEASYVLILHSIHSLESNWVKREWMSALANQATVVIPVLLDNSDLPFLLRDIISFDLRENRETGLEEIAAFFQNELKLVPRRIRRPGNQPVGPVLKGVTRRQLRLISSKCMDQKSLIAFCFDANIDPNGLEGNSVHGKLLFLLHQFSTENLLDDFANWLEVEKMRCVKAQINALTNQPLWNWGTKN